ncbi:AGAP009989-PA-like protein [Anopheles sinensis]|uniref:AGAP009989-PA-like protein n=1 Tax=Anopheles sinensis TaxID=74873 RepID=A0A084VSR6_ANOSI|nr:AGAP009989-PA-like protein [Anopheles sinensis]
MVKNEVDVTLKGNQWPLSCFGPFKERTCIPNFIDDQSFEEIRMMYLEAKLQNNIPAHQMQLAQMINDAKTKLQWLTTMNGEVLGALVELYNQQESSAKQTGVSSNPFASIGTNNTSGTNSSATSSIFGGATSGSAFGSSFGTISSASVPGTTGGIFGQAAQSGGSIFGSAASSTTGNIFAKAGASQPQGNIFGMAQPSQPTNSIFGGPAVLGGGLFGSAQPSATSTPLFGSVATQPNPSVGGSIFAKPAQPSNAFGQPVNPSGAFGGGNIFGSSAVAATPATGFGAVAAQPQQGAGLFNSVSFGPTQTASSSFGQFGASMQPAAPANPSSQNLFLPTPAASLPAFGVSGAKSAFGAVASDPLSANRQIVSEKMYSKAEELTAEQLAAFNADQFQLGRIPTVPPPEELCR